MKANFFHTCLVGKGKGEGYNFFHTCLVGKGKGEG